MRSLPLIRYPYILTLIFKTGALLILLLFLGTHIPAVQAAGPLNRPLTIESAILMAIENNPILEEATLNVKRAGMDLKKYEMQKFIPKFKVNFITGLVPEAKGSIFSSQNDVNELNGLGPFYKVDIEMIKPLYTFGRLGSAIMAGKEGLNFERSKREKTVDDLSLKVVKAYWALYFATKAEALAGDLQNMFDEILSTVKERLEDENSSIDDSDYLKVKSSAFTIEEQFQKSVELKKLSRLLLIALLDLDPDDRLEFSPETTPGFTIEEEWFDKASGISRESSPLIRGINSVIRGLQAKINLLKSNRYPVIFLAARFRYAHADNRTDQSNPFVVDDFNFREIGAALGMEWKPDFVTESIEIKKARLQHLAAVKKREMLSARVDMETRQALLRLKRNKILLKAARSSLKAAKSWLRTSGDNWEMGLGDLNRLLDAYQTYYRLRGVEIDKANQYNVSLAELAYALGDMKLYLKWIKEGEVSFD